MMEKLAVIGMILVKAVVTWVLVAVPLIFLAIWGVSLFLRATSRPTPTEVQALTSSQPDEKLIDYRVANSRNPDGLWIGGRVFLTNYRLMFETNVLNEAFTGHEAFVVPLAEIKAIRLRGAIATVIDVETSKGVGSFRGARSRKFAHDIEAAVAKLRP